MAKKNNNTAIIIVIIAFFLVVNSLPFSILGIPDSLTQFQQDLIVGGNDITYFGAQELGTTSETKESGSAPTVYIQETFNQLTPSLSNGVLYKGGGGYEVIENVGAVVSTGSANGLIRFNDVIINTATLEELTFNYRHEDSATSEPSSSGELDSGSSPSFSIHLFNDNSDVILYENTSTFFSFDGERSGDIRLSRLSEQEFVLILDGNTDSTKIISLPQDTVLNLGFYAQLSTSSYNTNLFTEVARELEFEVSNIQVTQDASDNGEEPGEEPIEGDSQIAIFFGIAIIIGLLGFVFIRTRKKRRK